jgi:SEC-C motif domain protein
VRGITQSVSARLSFWCGFALTAALHWCASVSRSATNKIRTCGKMHFMPTVTTPPCPCRTEQGPASAYADCCGRYHAGPLALQAPTAEALMRSRYSAFVLKLSDYLLATWHPSTRPSSLDLNEPGLKWLGLAVKKFEVQDPTHATVEFIARSKQGGRAQRLREVSRFVWEKGRWFYLEGNGE